VIRATGLARRFGEVEAVRDVSFEAEDGRITGLLGPNGAGKSTTLRMLGTLIRPDAGSASIDGHDVTTDALAARRALGALPHGAGIYPRLTARENVRYYGQLQGMAGDALEARIDALADLLEMREFVDRRAKGFSQGQKTKVALARALVHGPRNLLLDEPTNGLDVMATRSLRELIGRLREDGTCVLFSSHVMQRWPPSAIASW